ncbi:MAG TPA: Pycsar system effector family protein [Saprospiraceae bacterium]|nr:Pycsar system effector family protein [Saprospiraceae bacterium]
MENTPEKKDDSTGASVKGKDTIFRVAAPNQIGLIAIADNKSNMLIGICVVLISLIIALLGSGFTIQGTPINTRPDLIIPMTILLFFMLSAAVCAIIAAKPKIIKGTTQSMHSLLFFQNIFTKTLDQYLAEMHELLEDKKAIYDQMIIDMYNNGVVLHRKYQMLRVAYFLFMYGLIISVLAFVITTAIVQF